VSGTCKSVPGRPLYPRAEAQASRSAPECRLFRLLFFVQLSIAPRSPKNGRTTCEAGDQLGPSCGDFFERPYGLTSSFFSFGHGACGKSSNSSESLSDPNRPFSDPTMPPFNFPPRGSVLSGQEGYFAPAGGVFFFCSRLSSLRASCTADEFLDADDLSEPSMLSSDLSRSLTCFSLFLSGRAQSFFFFIWAGPLHYLPSSIREYHACASGMYSSFLFFFSRSRCIRS